MWKFGFLSLQLALFASIGLSQVLNHFWPISTREQLLNQVFFLSSGLILLFLYHKRSAKPDFPAFLLGALIVRLLASLIYILVMAFVIQEHFRAVAFHFLSAFALYTVADVMIGVKILQNKS